MIVELLLAEFTYKQTLGKIKPSHANKDNYKNTGNYRAYLKEGWFSYYYEISEEKQMSKTKTMWFKIKDVYNKNDVIKYIKERGKGKIYSNSGELIDTIE